METKRRIHPGRWILVLLMAASLSACTLEDLIAFLQANVSEGPSFSLDSARWEAREQTLALRGRGAIGGQGLWVYDAVDGSFLANEEADVEDDRWTLDIDGLLSPPCRVRVETDDGRSDTAAVEGAPGCNGAAQPPGGGNPPPTGGTVPLPGPVSQGAIKVFAFNDLGMHCMDENSSVFSLLPPFNTLHAQVVATGREPRLLGDDRIQVRYRAAADPSGSVNSTSIGKTDFWDNVQALFGTQPPPDTGLTGSKMPSAANGPQPFSTYDPDKRWFVAQGIPLTPIDDAGRYNPYPIFRVEARDVATGTLHSDLDVVVPVSTEMNCSDCHHTGGRAADDATASRYGIRAWSTANDPVVQYKENILILHDAKHGTRLPQPTLCASCHYSAALDLEGTGPQNDLPYLSRAIHGRHGRALDGRLPDAANPPIIAENGLETCYSCHPGKHTQCFRGVMFQAGLSCQNCHGGLLTVAGTYPLADGSIRRPWIDLPRCGACHTGGQQVRTLAYDPNDPAATPLPPMDRRFAENDGALYRDSVGHGGMACAACHGSPHAIWPVADPQANDHLTARELQGHAGTIVECTVCHTGGAPATLGGPHGMHPVGDDAWLDRHGDLYERDPDSCRRCHGADLQGGRLSKAAVERVLNVEDKGRVVLPAGRPVGCDLCHKTPR